MWSLCVISNLRRGKEIWPLGRERDRTYTLAAAREKCQWYIYKKKKPSVLNVLEKGAMWMFCQPRDDVSTVCAKPFLLDVKQRIRSPLESPTPTVAAEGHLLTEIIELNGIKALSLNRMWPADVTAEWEAGTGVPWLRRFARAARNFLARTRSYFVTQSVYRRIARPFTDQSKPPGSLSVKTEKDISPLWSQALAHGREGVTAAVSVIPSSQTIKSHISPFSGQSQT